MDVLLSSEDRQVERKSSIDQYKNKLSVYSQGAWLPISYDVLDGVTCEGLRHHRAIVTDDKTDLGYNYQISECKRYTAKYLFHDTQTTELRELPEWFGAGLYDHFINGQSFTNADNGAVGTFSLVHYRVGTDYYKAKESLPSA